jgi:predicted ATPase
MTVPMLLRKIKLENLLSFRSTEVELRALNVLIGANASGKSNLIEAIGLLQALPVDLNGAIRRLGGVHVVCSLAIRSPIAGIRCERIDDGPLAYELKFAEQAGGFTILIESLGSVPPEGGNGSEGFYFRRRTDRVALGGNVNEVSPTQSFFELYRNPADETPITGLGRKFARIRVYREFRTTGDSQTRLGTSTSSGKESLHDGADNLAVVLLDMNFRGLHGQIQTYLRRFCDRFDDVKVNLDGPVAKTYIQESGLLEPLTAWRLSDGTLKFLCLLAVLLDPNPAPLICIEEPEVGLHPEAIQIVADALIEASERTQLIVTTHSEALIDALSERPEDVLVTERDFDNGTQFRRLDQKQLSLWLEQYSLGRLWRMGEIGGTRW